MATPFNFEYLFNKEYNRIYLMTAFLKILQHI